MKKFLKDESGATAIEYGLIASAIGLMLIVAAPILAAAISALFSELGAGMARSSA
jgi:pilus assembly protein Flp/PilA